MKVQAWLVVGVAALVAAPALAQDSAGNERKALAAGAETLKDNPGIYFYVCHNGLGQLVLRASRRPLAKADGFHPDAPPIVRDLVLEKFAGDLSAAGKEKLVAECRAHNELAPKAPKAQLKPPTEPKTPEPARPADGAKPPASAPLPEVKLAPLDAEVTQPGERFSNHAQKLFEIIGGPYDLNGKSVAPRPSQEETLQHAEYILTLTQSANVDLRQAALLTCALQSLRSQYRSEAEMQNANLEVALQRRLRDVVERSLKNKTLDLQDEFTRLAKDGAGGIADETLGPFGQALGALFFTDEFRKHEEQQFRSLVIGTLALAARSHMQKFAGEAAAGAAARPFDVSVIYDPKDKTYVQISNRTRKPQRHVLICTRSVADPDYVQRTANMYRLQGKLAEAFDLFPQQATAKMPNMVDLWQSVQMLDFGAVVYIPEVSPSGTIKVALSNNERLSMTKDVRVSLWSDELIARDLKASNLDKVLEECRAPPKAQPLAKAKPFVPSITPPAAPPPKPKNAAEAREQAKKQAEKDGLAAFSLQLAQGSIARGDDHMAEVYLVQAINAAPDSPAGKKAKKLLEKYQK